MSVDHQNFKELADKFKEAQEEAGIMAAKEYDLLVEKLIASGTKEGKLIDGILDELLEFAYDKNVFLIFKKLCRYYYPIDREGAEFYVRSYWETRDEEILDIEDIKN